MNNKLEDIIKKIAILCIVEVIVLSFAVVYGLENGFKLWNWLTIIIGISLYLIITIVVVIKENKGKTKVSKEELIVSDYYKEQAQKILDVLDKYLAENIKVANDLKLYWPFYKGILKRISNGKKLNSKDYGMIEKLNIWQIQNHEDTFLMNIYDVLKQNIV